MQFRRHQEKVSRFWHDGWKTGPFRLQLLQQQFLQQLPINTVKGEWLIKTARDIMFFGFVMLACPVSFLKKDSGKGMTG